MDATSTDATQSQLALTIVNPHLHFPRVSLIEPSSSHFVHIASEIDKRPPFLPSSRAKRVLRFDRRGREVLGMLERLRFAVGRLAEKSGLTTLSPEQP